MPFILFLPLSLTWSCDRNRNFYEAQLATAGWCFAVLHSCLRPRRTIGQALSQASQGGSDQRHETSIRSASGTNGMPIIFGQSPDQGTRNRNRN